MLVLLYQGACFGQDAEFSHRVIFVGDAGEVNGEQLTALAEAADRVIVGKTIVVFLGDNVYPRGIGLPGDRKEGATKQVLKSQFWPMRTKGAPVYFIPGNHDRSNREGHRFREGQAGRAIPGRTTRSRPETGTT